MGLCKSKPLYIAASAGGESDYQKRFLESKILGQGEFGAVKLVHDVKHKDLLQAKPLAVKYLKKGYTFRDNTLYTPIKKKTLVGEVEILRALNGECYNLKLVEVYESPSTIYVVTEYCEGGEMVPWVSSAFKDSIGLRTEDVSRICYQMWSAIAHCAKHKVIHRDIKPQNVMFCTDEKDSELRLIDFGSGTMDGLEGSERGNSDSNVDDTDRHHTFAGSAFYISPEMFQKTYTNKTDVWSAGATLYVLVAGYPSDRLQETFNILQSNTKGRLRNLPNLPENMPSSFYEMLEGALAYRYKERSEAGQLMKGEFSQFHIHHEEAGGGKPGTISIHEVAAEAAGEHAITTPEIDNFSGSKKTISVVLEGSVSRHNAYLEYQQFERSVTTLLATMLSKDTCQRLIVLLREQHQKVEGMKDVGNTEKSQGRSNSAKLQVVTIKVLLKLLDSMAVEDDKEVKEVMATIQALKSFKLYENFAYHISLLRQFASVHTRYTSGGKGSDGDDEKISSVHGSNVWSTMVRKKKHLGSSGHGGDPDTSTKSTKSNNSFKGIGMRKISTATGALSSMA